MEISKLHLTNFLSYEQASLNLKDRGLVLIEGQNLDSGGSNGSGKSALFEAVLFALFGKTTRYGAQNTKVSRNGAGGTCVCLELFTSGNNVLVYRHRDHTKFGNKLLVYVNEKDLTKGSDSETQKVLESIIGMDYEVFQSVVLFAQGASGFASMTDAGQKYVLEQILGTQRFTDAHDRAKDKKKQLETAFQSVKASLFELNRSQESRKKRLLDLREKEQNFGKEKAAELQKLAQEQTTLQEQKPQPNTELLAKIQSLQVDLSSASNTKSRQLAIQTQSRIRDVELEKRGKETTANSISATLAGFAVEEPARPEYPSSHYSDDLSRVQIQVATLQADLRRDAQELRDLEEQIGGVDTLKDCPTCGQPVSTNSRKRMMGEAGTKRGALLIKVGEKEKTLKGLQSTKEIVEGLFYGAQVHEAWETGELKRLQLKTVQSDLESIALVLVKLKEMLTEVSSVITDLEAKDKELNKLRQENEQFQSKLSLWEMESKNLTKKIQEAENKQSPYLALLAKEDLEYESSAVEYARKFSLYTELDLQIKVLEFWSVGFSPRGVRSLLLDECTPLLNDRASEYLNYLTDDGATVEFSTISTLASGEQKDKFSVEVSYVNGAAEYRGTSGGERRRVDIASIFALGDLAASRASSNVDLRLLDEVFESLDSRGCEKVIGLLKEKILPRSRTVLVMSHNEDLKAFFDQRITVIKQGGISRIEDHGN